MSEGLKKVYCNHCKKKFKTDARIYHNQFENKLTIKCSCPYCDLVELENVEQHYIKFFKELNR